MLAQIRAAVEIADKTRIVWEKLNTKRTVLIELRNDTDQTLRVQSHDHDHGGFAEPPDRVVPPRTVSIFGSQSKAGSVGTGTEGRVTYTIDGVPNTTYLVTWNNPFLGSNGAHAAVRGERAAAFAADDITGSGNDAHMKYDLSQVRDPRLVRSPDYRHVALEGYILAPETEAFDPDAAPAVLDGKAALWSFWSPGREDNHATTHPALIALPRSEPDYRRYRLEGYVFRPDRPRPAGTVPLHSWYSRTRGDNHATANAAFTDPVRSRLEPNYQHNRLEGFIYPPDRPQPPRTVALHSWYSPRRGDNFATTDARWRP
jgi:hypothetical protein